MRGCVPLCFACFACFVCNRGLGHVRLRSSAVPSLGTCKGRRRSAAALKQCPATRLIHQALRPILGTYEDIPAPDMNTGAREMVGASLQCSASRWRLLQFLLAILKRSQAE